MPPIPSLVSGCRAVGSAAFRPPITCQTYTLCVVGARVERSSGDRSIPTFGGHRDHQQLAQGEEVTAGPPPSGPSTRKEPPRRRSCGAASARRPPGPWGSGPMGISVNQANRRSQERVAGLQERERCVCVPPGASLLGDVRRASPRYRVSTVANQCVRVGARSESGAAATVRCSRTRPMDRRVSRAEAELSESG